MGSWPAEQALVLRVLQASEGKREASERGVRDTRDVGMRRKERKEVAFLRRAYISLYARPPAGVSSSQYDGTTGQQLRTQLF